MPPKIILATNSKNRHEMAKKMGLDFEIMPSNYEEDMTLNLPYKELAMTLALGKAQDVAKKLNKEIVIGIDTFVVFNNKIIGKPKDEQDAFNTLKSLSNNSHEVYSGISIINCKTNQIIKDFEITKVYFKKMSDNEIKRYIATGEPMGKAGSYGIQDLSSIFITKIEGCFYNIVGFPIYNIYKNLQKLGIDIFEYEKWQPKCE